RLRGSLFPMPRSSAWVVCRRPGATDRSPPGEQPGPERRAMFASLVIPLCDAVGDVENPYLPIRQIAQLGANPRFGRFLAGILLAVGARPGVDAHLHGPDHLQLGDLVEQLLILGWRRLARLRRVLLVVQFLPGLL